VLAVGVLPKRIELDPRTRDAEWRPSARRPPRPPRRGAPARRRGGGGATRGPRRPTPRRVPVAARRGTDRRPPSTAPPGRAARTPWRPRRRRRRRARPCRASPRGRPRRRAQSAPDGDELGSQALARARVEHVGPETTGHLRTRVHARMQSEPAEQRACPPALGHRQCDPSDSSANAPNRRTRSMATGYPRPLDRAPDPGA
jgi:hypothetical protein